MVAGWSFKGDSLSIELRMEVPMEVPSAGPVREDFFSHKWPVGGHEQQLLGWKPQGLA